MTLILCHAWMISWQPQQKPTSSPSLIFPMPTCNFNWMKSRRNRLPSQLTKVFLQIHPSAFRDIVRTVIISAYDGSIEAGIPNVVVYIDDILVVGRSVDEHLQTLEAVLKRLEEAGLRLKLPMCSLLESMECLGHQISGEGIQPTANKKQAILEAPTPQNLSQLRSFLGLLNYYGKFLPNLASILSPLYSLQKKHARWQ